MNNIKVTVNLSDYLNLLWGNGVRQELNALLSEHHLDNFSDMAVANYDKIEWKKEKEFALDELGLKEINISKIVKKDD